MSRSTTNLSVTRPLSIQLPLAFGDAAALRVANRPLPEGDASQAAWPSMLRGNGSSLATCTTPAVPRKLTPAAASMKGGWLPPGIAKQQLPADLARRLPPVPSGYERVVVDGRVLLVEIATQVIHDVLEDLIF